jgi:hypothetical protein
VEWISSCGFGKITSTLLRYQRCDGLAVVHPIYKHQWYFGSGARDGTQQQFKLLVKFMEVYGSLKSMCNILFFCACLAMVDYA